MLIPWSFPKGNFIQISAQRCPAEASRGSSCPVPRVPAAPRAATPPEGTAARTCTGFSPKTYPKKTHSRELGALGALERSWRCWGIAGACTSPCSRLRKRSQSSGIAFFFQFGENYLFEAAHSEPPFPAFYTKCKQIIHFHSGDSWSSRYRARFRGKQAAHHSAPSITGSCFN